jgi:hypothetical protein
MAMHKGSVRPRLVQAIIAALIGAGGSLLYFWAVYELALRELRNFPGNLPGLIPFLCIAPVYSLAVRLRGRQFPLWWLVVLSLIGTLSIAVSHAPPDVYRTWWFEIVKAVTSTGRLIATPILLTELSWRLLSKDSKTRGGQA